MMAPEGASAEQMFILSLSSGGNIGCQGPQMYIHNEFNHHLSVSRTSRTLIAHSSCLRSDHLHTNETRALI